MQEQEAIRRCQAGEMEALGILFELHQHAVLRTAYGITGNYDLAQDVTQQVFIELMTAIKRYDPGRPFPPWLHRIAVHRSLDKLRRSANRTVPIDDAVALPSTDSSPEDEAEKSELRATIWAAVGTLSPKHRAVLILRYYHDFSEAKMAIALGCPRGTVKSRLDKALRCLRQPPNEPDPGLANATPELPLAPIGPRLANTKLPRYGETAERVSYSSIPVQVEVEPC